MCQGYRGMEEAETATPPAGAVAEDTEIPRAAEHDGLRSRRSGDRGPMARCSLPALIAQVPGSALAGATCVPAAGPSPKRLPRCAARHDRRAPGAPRPSRAPSHALFARVLPPPRHGNRHDLPRGAKPWPVDPLRGLTAPPAEPGLRRGMPLRLRGGGVAHLWTACQGREAIPPRGADPQHPCHMLLGRTVPSSVEHRQ
jgi:hypothetical protein